MVHDDVRMKHDELPQSDHSGRSKLGVGTRGINMFVCACAVAFTRAMATMAV